MLIYFRLQTLVSGADGIWGSVCNEGAAMGNASSCVTILNLVRMGNRKILKKFNCAYLRQAAINVTKVSTGIPPHKNQPIYGTRALDFVFDLNPEEFDLATFFGEQAPTRITSLSSPEMIRDHLEDTFGKNEAFTNEVAYKMKELILEDLRGGRWASMTNALFIYIFMDSISCINMCN